MDSRELFLKVMNFEKSKRTLKWEFGFWGGTIQKWKHEGYSEKILFERSTLYGEFICGPGSQFPIPSYDDELLYAKDLALKFNLDKGPSPVPFNWFYYPKFKKEILETTKNKIKYIGTDGITRISFKDERSMPLWVGHPIRDEEDWERIKTEKLNMNDFWKRFTVKNPKEALAKLRNRDFPQILYGSPIGFFGILRFMIGEEKLYIWYYDKPKLLKSILEYLCEFWINIAQELLLYTDFDYGCFFEDMAYNKGSLISPDIFNEFMLPYYKKLINFAKSKEIKNFIVDSDGFIEKLIPLFMECGVTGLFPFEIRAGNDIEKIRKLFPRLQILGGIDKTALENKKDIDLELEKVKRMIAQGGYIPYVDHAIPPNISWENFNYYREKLNFIIDNQKVL
jgi:uroporphyrinogen-III decarboxylase